MARTYKRDSRGRFAGGGGGRVRGTGGTLGARTSLRNSRQKLENNASAAQRGAVTRGSRKLAKVQQENRTRISTGPSNVLRKGRKTTMPPAGNVPRSGRVPSPRPKPASNIRNNGSIPGRGGRQMNRAVDRIADNLNSAGASLKRARSLSNSIDRMGARDALRPGALNREIARQSGSMSPARKVIQRRQQRAFNVQNGRNPEVGAKALYIYQSQLRSLGSPSNQRSTFRRKPLTPKQAERAAAARKKADMKRLDKALRADVKQQVDAKMAERKAKEKAKAKRKRKS